MQEAKVAKISFITDREQTHAFYKVSILFTFAYFTLPQYFGIQVAGFDFTAQRICMLILCLYIFDSGKRVQELWKIIVTCKYTPFIALYMFVLLYTAVYRGNVNTFLYSFIEFFCMYLLIYIIRDVFGVERFVKILLKFIYVLCILGIFEYIFQKSFFSYLEMIPGLFTGGMIRSGSYRIMGPCNHSLGYGLLLVTVVPFACIDFVNNKLNLLENKFLFLLIGVNVFLTGSRSTLAVFALEVILFILFSSKEKRRKVILNFAVIIVVTAVLLLCTQNLAFSRYILMQVWSVIDELFGTEYAVNYGASVTTLANSSDYRDLLPKIFTLNWLNPIVGRGSVYQMSVNIEGRYIKSIDNFYVAQYIRFAYPGLITYLLLLLSVLINMLVSWKKTKFGPFCCVLIGCICYFINLWWVDTLQTIKYVYILFAIYEVLSKSNSVTEKIVV